MFTYLQTIFVARYMYLTMVGVAELLKPRTDFNIKTGDVSGDVSGRGK